MRHSRLAGFFMALGIRAVLDLVPGGKARVAREEGRSRGARAQTVSEPRTADPRRARLPLALLTVGAISMLAFEGTITRVVGIVALFAWVVAGVFAIADPRWLAGAPELGHADGDEGARTRRSG